MIEKMDIEKEIKFPKFDIDKINLNDKEIELIFEKKNNNDIYISKQKLKKTLIKRIKPLKINIKLKKIRIPNKLQKNIENKKGYNDFIEIFNKEKFNKFSFNSLFNVNISYKKNLSTVGSEIDIPSLILYLINPNSEPLFFLENKEENMGNNSISIIIDNSISCLNEFSITHSIQTIAILLNAFSNCNIPNFDLIVSGEENPFILCSGINSLEITKSDSTILQSLYLLLKMPSKNTDLLSSINVAFSLKKKNNTIKKSILFILTDGLYDHFEQNKIINYLKICETNEMNVIGIGLGIYPKRIENIFNNYIYSSNPLNIVKGINEFYENNNEKKKEIKEDLYEDDKNRNINDDILKLLKESINNPTFKDLKTELEKIIISVESFDFYYKDFHIFDVEKKIKSINTDSLYDKDILKSQKILIVMLWRYDMSENESEYIKEEFLLNPNLEQQTLYKFYENDDLCIKKAADYYGVELKIVINYEDAINELTKQTKKGFCDYYAVWVFCGPPYPVLPKQNKENENKDNPYLISQFIDVLIKYWENKGSIFFLAEGNKLHYQLDLFLKRAKFPKYGEVKFEIKDEHKGGGYLKGVFNKDFKLNNKGIFNKNIQRNEFCERASFGHLINELFEGETISYVENNENIKPFIPFAIDNLGGINSLFYCADEEGHGDIIIDCGFTKCFKNMNSKGTYKYFENIIGWMGKPEINFYKTTQWRPSSINYKINKNDKWNEFEEIINPKKYENIICN